MLDILTKSVFQLTIALLVDSDMSLKNLLWIAINLFYIYKIEHV